MEMIFKIHLFFLILNLFNLIYILNFIAFCLLIFFIDIDQHLKIKLKNKNKIIIFIAQFDKLK